MTEAADPTTTTDDDVASRIPADAGEYASGLGRLLARIPRPWGRWISCGPGWYPILADLDQAIAAIEPGYEAHQVKEKYGTLRFYWGLPEIEAECCTAFEAANPCPVPGPVKLRVPNGRTPREQAAIEAWWSRYQAHYDSPEHEAGWAAVERLDAARQPARDRIEALVAAAEERSAHTCELCGSTAQARARVRGGWVKTLCVPCATQHGYPTGGRDADAPGR